MLSERMVMAASGRLGNWLSGWDNRIQLTINNSNVDEDLSDFPVMVHLSTSSGITGTDVSAIFDELTSNDNRKKVAITSSDGVTELYVEIERWDSTSEEAWLWVKIPEITSEESTILYLYYDINQADNTSYIGDTTDTVVYNVWDENFIGVWHLAQDPNGDAASVIKNSTSNAIHATPVGSMTSADLVDGKVGKGIDFDGNDDYLSTPDATDVLNITDILTLECIFKPTNILDSDLTVNSGLISRQHYPTANRDTYAMFINPDGKLQLGSFGGNIQGTKASWSNTDWWCVAGTYDSTSLSGDLFVDGVKETLSVNSYDSMAGGSNSLLMAQIVTTDPSFDGIMDEVRVSNSIRSDAWIKATNYSNRDTFITFSAPWLGGWDNRIRLTIDHTKVDGNMSDFPAMVHLSTTSGIIDTDVSAIFDELISDANRKKIAVTSSNGLTQLYVEIERWDDTNEKAWLWVKTPGVSSEEDTILYLYYDVEQADNTSYVGDTGDGAAQNVWDDNFVGVWHMAQDPNGDVADTIKDSTINGYHGTPAGSMTSADLVDGKIGKAIDFDGDDDYIDIGDVTILDGETACTLEFILNRTAHTANGVFIRKWAAGQQSFSIGQDGSNTEIMRMMINDTGEVNPLIGDTIDGALVNATPMYIAGIWSGADALIMYENITSRNVGYTQQNTPVSIANTTERLCLAGRYNAGVPDSFTNGIMEEIRISKIDRAAAWIKATYYSNWDSLITFSAPTESWLPGWDNRIKLTVDHTKVDGTMSDFPIMIHLSTTSGITNTDVSEVFDELKSDANRKKIAVTSSDGLTQLYVEIEFWDDTNEKAWLWVKVPAVDLDVDTFLYLYYDVNQDDNTSYVGDTGDTVAKNVWDENFIGVWHMAQDPDETQNVLYAPEIVGTTANPSIAAKLFTPVDCTGLTKANGMLKVELKASDPSIITTSSFEITSSGTNDSEEWAHTLTAEDKARLSTSYQVFFIPLSDAITTGGELDVSQIDYIRWWASTTGADITIHWQNAELIWPAHTILDSTINVDHGTPIGSMTSDDLIDGRAIEFDGVDDIIYTSSPGILGANARTLETIFKAAAGAGDNSAGLVFWGSYVNGQKWNFTIDTINAALRTECQGANLIATTNVEADDWRHGVSIFDGTNMDEVIHYLNGVLDAETSSSSFTINTGGIYKVTMGGQYSADWYYMPVQISEVRISNVARSAAWLKATYYSSWDTLITFFASIS